MDSDHLRLVDADGRGRTLLGSTFADKTVALQVLSVLNEDDDYNVGFVRHGRQTGQRFGLEPTGLYELYLDDYVAIDWGLGGHTSRALYDADDSEQAKRDLNAFRRFRRNGALVFAYYPSVFKDASEMDKRPKRAAKLLERDPDISMLAKIGYIEPGTDIEHKQFPKRSPQYPPVEGSAPSADDAEMRDYTALKMTNVVEVSDKEYPELFDTDAQPAHASASGWRNRDEEVIEAYFSEYQV